VVDWARAEDVGFSRFVSLGNQADVTEAEILAYLGNDSHTGVITLYLESVVDGRAFMEVARDVARRKPIVGLKVGRTDAGARAAASHTGALTGTDDVYAAAFRQCGVLRVGTIEALFDAARTFAGHTEVDGDAVVIVSNAGGPAVLAADALAEAGLCLADLGTETQIQIQAGVPASAEVSNPVDILGGADGAVYHRTLTAALADPNVDAAIAIHVPQALVAPTEVADAIVRAATQRAGPSVVACFMGGETVAAARDLLRSHGITEYPTPERAAQSLGGLAWRRQWLDRPSEPATAIADADAAAVRDWLSAASTAGQSMLAGPRAFDVLRAYGIPAVETRFADTAGHAVAAAGTIGYPVVLKAVAPWLVHKTEVGGVALGLADAEAVEDAFERLTRPNLGSRAGGAHSQATPDGVLVQRMAPAGWEVLAGFIRDPQFGPVVVYGLGGIYVEALGDVSFRVAPLTRVDAREMIEETRSARLLAGVRGQAPADVDALSVILQRLGRLALDQPEIAELDINPLIATGEGAVAIDVRIGLASGAEAPRSSR
jgi:acyl-CoA synthetase (NDP forming)